MKKTGESLIEGIAEDLEKWAEDQGVRSEEFDDLVFRVVVLKMHCDQLDDQLELQTRIARTTRALLNATSKGPEGE